MLKTATIHTLTQPGFGSDPQDKLQQDESSQFDLIGALQGGHDVTPR